MRKLLVAAGLLAVGLLSAAPDCSQVYHFSTRASDQADGVVTFTAVGATPGVNNKLFGCSAWIMNVDVEGLSGSSVTLQSAPQGGPNFAGTYVTFAGTLSSGSNPTTTTTSSASLFTGYFPWLRVNVGTMTGTGSINIQLFGWRSQAYLTAAAGSGAVADGTTICGTTTFSICANGVGNSQLATSTLQVATISISSAQLLALNTSPVTIIVAQGPSACILPTLVVGNTIFGGTAYTIAGALFMAWDGPTTSYSLASLKGALGVGGGSTNNFSFDPIGSNFPTSANCLNKALVFYSNVSNPTLGNGTVSLTIYYTVISGLS